MLVSQDCTDKSSRRDDSSNISGTGQVDSEQICYFHGTSICCVPTKCQALLGTEVQERTLLLLSKIQQLLTGRQRENTGYFENGELNNGKSLNLSWGKI